jgi:hypothetical protein
LRLRGLLWLALVVVVGYGALTTYRAYQFYAYVKSGQPLMSNGVFEFDPELGFAPRRGSRGQMLLPLSTEVPVAYDHDRLRIPAASAAAASRPLVLALGDSVTHADACTAEESYAYLIGRALGGRTLNAGFPAYGLAQMLLRGRELIPKYRPDYVIVEYAPWLVSRALSEFAPTAFGARPQPFFTEGSGGALHVEPPVFATTGFGYPAVEYRGTPSGCADFVSFVGRVAGPLFVGDDLRMLGFRVRRLLGHAPPPASDRERVVRSVYGELGALSEAAGSQMIVAIVGMPRDQPVGNEVAALKTLKDVPVVETWRALLERLPDPEGGTFLRTYAHYAGDPPVLIDPHPNAHAHAIMAEAIERAIQQNAESRSPK